MDFFIYEKYELLNFILIDLRKIRIKEKKVKNLKF